MMKTMEHLNKETNKESGFTLIEVMIAMAIFIIVVTIGIGAVLDATSAHYRSKNIRTVMDNLNFVMEDMARNIRLGSDVRCVPSGETPDISGASTIVPLSCANPFDPSEAHSQIVFKNLNGQYQLYAILRPTPSSSWQIDKAVQGGTLSSITPPEVSIDFSKSGFTVRGAQGTADGDFQQPLVTIRLAGTITYKDVPTAFAIQTTVALRQIDL